MDPTANTPVDAQLVIEQLRLQLSEAHFELAVLRARLTAPAPQEAPRPSPA